MVYFERVCDSCLMVYLLDQCGDIIIGSNRL